MEHAFAAAWLSLCRTLGAGTSGRDELERLSERYRESHRAYHTIEHILHGLKWFNMVRSQAAQPENVEAALWLHDVVYDPRASDNEERSAEWAVDALRSIGAAEAKIAKIVALILTTRHDRAPADGDAALQCA